MSLPLSSAPEPLTKQLGSPTYVRFGILGLTVLMSMILYLDRFAFGAAQKRITEDLALTEVQFGWITGAFFYAYALFQVPSALWADRFGGRGLLTLCVAGWSLCMWGMALAPNTLTGAAIPLGFLVMFLFRGLMGVTQACAYPTAAGYIREWMPLSTRSLANGFIAMGGRAGGLLTNVSTPFFIGLLAAFPLLAGFDWRIVFFVYGAIGLVWCVAFWFSFANRPDEHSFCNEAERDLIAEGKPQKPAEAVPLPPWGTFLLSRNLWLISGVNFFMNVSWIFLASNIQKFYSKNFQWTDDASGRVAALIGLGGIVGNLFGGVLNDFFVAQLGLKVGRRINGLVFSLLACATYLTCLTVSDPFVLAALFITISFFHDSELASRWAVSQDMGGKYTSTVVGFANMCGNLAAGACATAIGYLARDGRWDVVFVLSACSLVCTFACWFFIDPERLVVPEEK